MDMSEREEDARQAGLAAIVVLQVSLKTVQFRLHQLAAEVAEIQGYIGESQLNAAEVRELLEKRQGGDAHGG